MESEQFSVTSPDIPDFRESVAQLTSTWYNIELPLYTFEVLQEVRSTLMQMPECNLLLYFNHRSLDDALIISFLYNLLDPEGERKVYILITDHIVGKGRVKTFFPRLCIMPFANRYGVELLPIVRLPNRTKRNRRRTIMLDRGFSDKVKAMRGSTLAMSPEGAFSSTGSLQEAETGIVQIIRNMSPVVVLPVGYTIFNREHILCYCNTGNSNNPKYHVKGFNFGTHIHLTPGKPFFVPNSKRGSTFLPDDPTLMDTINIPRRNKKQSLQIIMQRLARTLPLQMRGPYSVQQP